MRKGISFVVAFLLVLSGAASCFAADSMEFTGAEVKMTLEEAQKMMLTSSTAIDTANYNLKADKAKTKGHYEDARNLNSLQKAADEIRGMGDMAGDAIWSVSAPSRTQKQMVDVAFKFAQTQTQRNYDAEVNQIKRDTVDTYYKLLQAKENVRISQENVAIQETLYKNTQSKFKLGVVSKQDVLKAEVGLNEAKVNAEKAQNLYTTARMGFNLLIGFDLMQNVNLTDSLSETSMSAISLDNAIKLAVENRNEVTGAAFGVKMAELALTETGNTVSKSSSKYLTAQAALQGAQDGLKNAPKAMEMDVRNKYMDMIQKKAEIELARMNVNNAKETYRLANLQYDAGMATLTDTQQAQILSYQLELALYSAILDYNLAVMDYELATTVGTTVITL